MGLMEEPLLHAIVAANADPDPRRAFRFHPFSYDRDRAQPPAAGPSSRRWTSIAAAIRRVGALAPSRPWPRPRPAAAPIDCGAPVCC